MVLSLDENNELFAPLGDGGVQEVGLCARLGAALTFLSRHPSVASCCAIMASVVSFSDRGTKFTLLLKLGSEPNRTSSTGGRGLWLYEDSPLPIALKTMRFSRSGRSWLEDGWLL